MKAIEQSTFQKRPAYAYIRESDKLPTIAQAVATDDTLARVKLFNPTRAGTWYVIAYDADDRVAYGYVTGLGGDEAGDFSMAELVDHRGRFGLPIERDLYFSPRDISELR